jgi:hypothetical protein
MSSDKKFFRIYSKNADSSLYGVYQGSVLADNKEQVYNWSQLGNIEGLVTSVAEEDYPMPPNRAFHFLKDISIEHYFSDNRSMLSLKGNPAFDLMM